MPAPFLIRFFRVVPPVPFWMHAAFVLAVISGGTALVLHLTPPAGALAPIVLLQMLATSSGFAVPARRGHYDLLLTSGTNRLHVAVAHWAASSIAGIAAWLAIAAIEAAETGEWPAVSFASGTIVAFAVLSLLPWAATVPLPRLTGGLIWLLFVVTSQAIFPAAFASRTAQSVLVSPWMLIGVRSSDLAPAVVLPVIAVTVAGTCAACAWIYRLNVGLQVAR
jgi:hypothetical protein